MSAHATAQPNGPPIPVPCRFFVQGYCKYADNCRFIHEMESSQPLEDAASVPLARPDINSYRLPDTGYPDGMGGYVDDTEGGTEAFSDFNEIYKALFDADLSEGADIYDRVLQPTKYADLLKDDGSASTRPRGGVTMAPGFQSVEILCSFHANNQCRYGDSCRYLHGKQCPACGKNVLHPTNVRDAEDHFNRCGVNTEFQMKLEQSATIECAICYEKPVEKRVKFGLLRECNHPFCLDCIREWRGNTEDFGGAVRHCPICRVNSYVVIPSPYYIEDDEEREALFQEYKSRTAHIPCKHFDYGDGECPFSTSCLYSHKDRSGRDLKDKLILDANGKAVVLREETNLLDFAR